MDWLDLLAVQGTLKSLLHHHSSKASILRSSAFFKDQLSHLYMTTGKATAFTRRTFVGKVMSLLFNMMSSLVIAFLARSKHLFFFKHLLISWLQSPLALILEPPQNKVWASLITQSAKNLPAMQETWVWFLGREDFLEKKMAIHSSILVWKIPWTEEPGGLQSTGPQESDTT